MDPSLVQSHLQQIIHAREWFNFFFNSSLFFNSHFCQLFIFFNSSSFFNPSLLLSYITSIFNIFNFIILFFFYFLEFLKFWLRCHLQQIIHAGRQVLPAVKVPGKDQVLLEVDAHLATHVDGMAWGKKTHSCIKWVYILVYYLFLVEF